MSPARKAMTRTITALVLVVLVLAVAAATFGTRQIVSDQEHRLLQQRTEELGFYLNGLTQSTGAELAQIGQVTRLSPDPVAAFTAAAMASKSPIVRQQALIRHQADGSFVVLATVGPDLKAGQKLGPLLANTAMLSLGTRTFVDSPVYQVNGHSVIALLMSGTAPPGEIVLQESRVDPEKPTATTTSGPYSELYVALYDGTRPVRSQLALANAPLATFRGRSATDTVHIGASPFLLVAAARFPLVGNVASNAQWFVLGVGLVLTLLLASLFDATQRRRDFALNLVDERTAALNDSLETLRQTQDQLVQSERLAAIGQLASTVGHELRNPLGVISNALYLLRRATASSPDERIPQHLATADREVAAATLIVSDLLEFSRGREPMLATVNLSDLVEEVFTVAPHPDAIRLDWSAPAEPVSARADRDQLRQVLLNLVTNAYDAMPEGGVLSVRTERAPDGQVQVSVADDGAGMDDATRSRIFEPFYTTKTRGVGLGLAVSHRIVTAHEGSLDVSSTPGRGSAFSVRLPGAEPSP